MKSILIILIISIIKSQKTIYNNKAILRQLESCPAGEFLKGDKCHKCAEHCIKCRDQTGYCLKCNDGFYTKFHETDCFKCNVTNCAECPFNPQCLECKDEFYLKDINNDTCVECDKNCLRCEDYKGCVSCIPYYYIKDKNCDKCEDNKCISCKNKTYCETCDCI